MKLCLENDIPIVHPRWLVLSIAFNFPLNHQSFNLNVHKDKDFHDMTFLLEMIKNDNKDEYVQECVDNIERNIEKVFSMKKSEMKED